MRFAVVVVGDLVETKKFGTYAEAVACFEKVWGDDNEVFLCDSRNRKLRSTVEDKRRWGW